MIVPTDHIQLTPPALSGAGLPLCADALKVRRRLFARYVAFQFGNGCNFELPRRRQGNRQRILTQQSFSAIVPAGKKPQVPGTVRSADPDKALILARHRMQQRARRTARGARLLLGSTRLSAGLAQSVKCRIYRLHRLFVAWVAGPASPHRRPDYTESSELPGRREVSATGEGHF